MLIEVKWCAGALAPLHRRQFDALRSTYRKGNYVEHRKIETESKKHFNASVKIVIISFNVSAHHITSQQHQQPADHIQVRRSNTQTKFDTTQHALCANNLFTSSAFWIDTLSARKWKTLSFDVMFCLIWIFQCEWVSCKWLLYILNSEKGKKKFIEMCVPTVSWKGLTMLPTSLSRKWKI